MDGHIALRDYWTRQWREIDPFVEPVKITIKQDGIVEVEVYQLVKDKAGNKIFEGKVKHVYLFQNNLIKGMEIKGMEIDEN